MFNMHKHAAENDGYQLRITFNRRTKLITLTGHILQLKWGLDEGFNSAPDGASLEFSSMEDVINHISKLEK